MKMSPRNGKESRRGIGIKDFDQNETKLISPRKGE